MPINVANGGYGNISQQFQRAPSSIKVNSVFSQAMKVYNQSVH